MKMKLLAKDQSTALRWKSTLDNANWALANSGLEYRLKTSAMRKLSHLMSAIRVSKHGKSKIVFKPNGIYEKLEWVGCLQRAYNHVREHPFITSSTERMVIRTFLTTLTVEVTNGIVPDTVR